MRRAAAWLVLGILGFVAVGCSDPVGVEDIIGIWNTTSINGYSVPGTVEYEGVNHDAEYARWVFYEGGQCTLTQHVDGSTETFDECEYTVDLTSETISVILLFEAWNGNLSRDRLTVTDPQDVVWLLVKQ